MSDDVERRVRDAMRETDLPPAPEALRASLGEIAAGPVETASRRSSRIVAGLAIAAVMVVGVVGLGALGGLDRLWPVPGGTPATTAGPMGQTPGPAATGGPSTTPMASLAEPPAGVTVLDAAGLSAAIAAQRAGGLASQVVVANVDIDPRPLPAVILRECADPLGSCTVIGTLAGAVFPDGTVTIRAEPYVVPPPITAADLHGPVALRLDGTAPIEYLGHLDPLAGTSFDVAALSAATPSAVPGRLVAVRGWLAGVLAPSCGPYMPETIPEPFRCPGLRGFLADQPVRPATRVGNGGSISVPDSAVTVQYGAYESFASSPANDGVNDEPRLGLYLVRFVASDTADCPACRGWLVVGRLDAAPAHVLQTAPPVPGAVVRSAAELVAWLGEDRTSLVGRAVIVDGRVVQLNPRSCGLRLTCDFGSLEGTTEGVKVSAYTASLLLPDTDYPLNGAMALEVRPDGLEYLGYMGSLDGRDFNAAVTDLTNMSQMPRGPMTVIVSGWLVAGPPVPCPQQNPAPPADTPFEPCPGAWLTGDMVQPWTVTPTSISMTPPAMGVRVQYGAYGQFAPDPAAQPDGTVAPRFGTYLVRLVTDTTIGPDGPRGWQVVGRLDP